MHYTPSVLRSPARWWWIASVLVHASIVGVVTVAPSPRPRDATFERAPRRMEFELAPAQSTDDRVADVDERVERADGGATLDPHERVTLGGARNAQNIDSRERGERGDGLSRERGRLMATRAESINLGVELRNAEGVDQVQRIRTGRQRESWQNDRRTPTPGDDGYVSLSAGEMWFRVARGPTAMPSRGEALRDGAATVRGERPTAQRPLGDTERATTPTAIGASASRAAAGTRDTDGSRASATGLASAANANIERGHASTTAERVAPRPSDDEDAAELATSLARDALNATVHAGAREGTGVGGVGGGGRAGVGGGVGEGGRARAYGEGDGALSLSSADPRYRRYFLALRRVLERLTATSFPEEDALQLREGRVMVELRVEPSGALHVLRLTRRSGIAQFDANVRSAIDGARGPAIPADVSTTSMRVIYDCLVENPVVR
jgi:TonB family protein